MIDNDAGPNAEQIEFWNGPAAEKWVDFNAELDRMLDPLGFLAMDRVAPISGEHARDVGCGCATTTLELARRVAPSGVVVGLDVSGPMLAVARERAKDAAAPVCFVGGDAEVCDLPAATFDLVYSRFGVMFFASPENAFANLLTALRPGGRLTCLTWQALGDNPWMQIPLAAAAKHLPPTGTPPDPTAPGPFAFASATRVEAIFTKAGFEKVAHESLKRDLLVGGGRSLDETVSFVMQLGPTGAALREADDELRAKVTSEIRSVIEPYHDGSGVRMPAAAWVVSARRPD